MRGETAAGSGTLETAGGYSLQICDSFVLGGLRPDRRNSADIFGSLCMPGIVSSLHPRPDSRAIAKKLAEANRDGRRHRLSLPQDVVEVLARNPQQAGDFRLGPAGRRDDVIAKQRPRMSRTAVLAALCRMDHACSFSGVEPVGVFLQRQFRLATGIAFGRCRRGRSRRTHKAPADRGSVPRILPNYDLGGAARAVISGQEYAVFQFDLVVERLEGPDVAV